MDSVKFTRTFITTVMEYLTDSVPASQRLPDEEMKKLKEFLTRVYEFHDAVEKDLEAASKHDVVSYFKYSGEIAKLL